MTGSLYVPRSQGLRKWHENIGRWDVFAFGWEEYGPPEECVPDPVNPDFETPTRTEYKRLCDIE